MLVPIDWLKKYTKVNENIDEYAEKMIMSGSNIETINNFGENLSKIVVGRIESVEKHMDSDHLLITKVDVGDGEIIQIVTGAQNVTPGVLVPVALNGSRLSDGTKIKKGKLRGVESNGMLCSAKELGFSENVIPVNHKDGIWLLPDEFNPGTDIVEALELKETVIDFEITPNRPDCLAMIGMARESAATFDTKLELPKTKSKNEYEDASNFIHVEIKQPELCRRYVARIVTDVVIKESPWWLQRHLMFAGMRPINNIVDITNFVMLEYGHPIHAFDIRTIQDRKILVDKAKPGEKFTTLDDTERSLTDDMLMIRDGKSAVAIAGVMGGLNSGIEDDTDTILVEAANFDMDSVRLTSKKLGLRTEASSRYEKGLSPELSREAADRVCYLIEYIGAGKVVGGAVDAYPKRITPPIIKARPDRINSILGTDIKNSKMIDILNSLGMKTEDAGSYINVEPPFVRIDLKEEIDICEEVARIYGYDNLEMTLHRDNLEAGMSDQRFIRDIGRDTLISMGLDEVQTYSFVSPKGVDNIRVATDSPKRDFVKLINPLGEENSVMRTTLIPEMLEVLSRNLARNISDVKAFEIGNTFMRGLGELPEEKNSLVIGMYGNNAGFLDMKGVIEELTYVFGINMIELKREESIETFHPGRCASIWIDGKEAGIIGEVHPDVADKYDMDTKVTVAELDMDFVTSRADIMRYYEPLPRYPFVTRDISLIVKEEVTVRQINDIIKEKGAPLLRDVTLFDIYRGKQIPDDMKSLSFNMTFRADDRTLTEEEVMPLYEKILAALKEDVDATLRDN